MTVLASRSPEERANAEQQLNVTNTTLDVQHAKQHQQHDNRKGDADEPKQNGHVNSPGLSGF